MQDGGIGFAAGVAVIARRLLVWTGALLGGFAASKALAAEYPQALPAEELLVTETLAAPFPLSYALVHDFGFGSLPDSAFSLVDTASGKYKGMLSAGNFATLDLSPSRQELYVGETYYSRGTRGDRADLLTVYDMATLARLAEIELAPKRGAMVTNKNASGITASERFLLVFNLTPATSVAVIDLATREQTAELSTPGCSLVYPTVGHDFFMLCLDGAALFISLNDEGREASRTRSQPFIDIDADPLSEKAARIGGVWHFASFRGQLQEVGADGQPGARWPLVTEAEAEAGWRPAGWHWTAGHPDGLLWVGMTPDGYDGSHKDPAQEVWLFDVEAQERQARLPLRELGMAIDVSLEDEPKLLVLNASGALDVYEALSGDYVRSILDLGASPLQVHRLEP